MLKKILSSVAAFALMGGAAVAQVYQPEVPSPAGITPGAPLAADPYTDRSLVAGEEPYAATGDVVIERHAAGIPVEQRMIVAGPVFSPIEVQSPAGLTPGAPLGSDPHSDQKMVVGDRL